MAPVLSFSFEGVDCTCNRGRRGFHQLVACGGLASLSNRWTACRKLKYGVKCWTPWLKEVGHTNLCGHWRWFLLGLLPLQILDFLIIILKGSFILAAETRIYCFDQTVFDGRVFLFLFPQGLRGFSLARSSWSPLSRTLTRRRSSTSEVSYPVV